MNILKEMILGAVIGCAALFIYILSLGIIVAYLPVNYSSLTAGLTRENAVVVIHLVYIFENFLASLPMVIVICILSRLLKLETTFLVIMAAIGAFLSFYLYTTGWTIAIITNIYFIVRITLVCAMLWFSLVMSRKLLLKKS